MRAHSTSSGQAVNQSFVTSILSLTLALTAVQCSKREAATTAQPPPAAGAVRTAPPPQETARNACAMVTAAEMSTILGTTVGAESDEGSTKCTYRPSDSIMPFVEVTVDRGGGSAAMVATRMLGRLEAGHG